MCEENEESDDEEEQEVLPSALIAKSVKQIKVVKKDDKMYPSLIDIECTTEVEGEEEEEETNTSSVVGAEDKEEDDDIF